MGPGFSHRSKDEILRTFTALTDVQEAIDAGEATGADQGNSGAGCRLVTDDLVV